MFIEKINDKDIKLFIIKYYKKKFGDDLKIMRYNRDNGCIFIEGFVNNGKDDILVSKYIIKDFEIIPVSDPENTESINKNWVNYVSERFPQYKKIHRAIEIKSQMDNEIIK